MYCFDTKAIHNSHVNYLQANNVLKDV